MKLLLIRGLLATVTITCLFYINIPLAAAEVPHDNTWVTSMRVYCNSCHKVHRAPGSNLTNNASNANLCLSCHTSGGQANNKKISGADEASAASQKGTHHYFGWTTPLRMMPSVNSPNNPYGLRWTTGLSNPALKSQLTQYNNVVTCSVCHNQHSQASAPWDPFAWTTIGYDAGTASVNGTTTTLTDSTRLTYWTNNKWATFFVKITAPTTSPNYGQIKQISGNTTTQLTVSSPWATITKTGEQYEIIGRKFQRTWTTLNGSTSAINDLCEDCHYYRKAGTTGTDINNWDGNKKSHPVMKVFSNAQGETPNVANPGEFNRAPFEPGSANWAWQTGARYHLSGGGDNKTENNIVLDSSKQIRCLSCHGVHYKDSDSSTFDAP